MLAALVVVVALAAASAVLIRGEPSGRTAPPRPSASASAAVPLAGSRLAVTASSVQVPDGGISYNPANLLDGRLETAWNSNGRKDGKGPGITLQFSFDTPVQLRSITVRNGYQKTTKQSGDLFTLNARVRGLTVVTDAGTWPWQLTDSKDPQTLTADFGRVSSVRFEVISIYPGSKYLDLALSEVGFGVAG